MNDLQPVDAVLAAALGVDGDAIVTFYTFMKGRGFFLDFLLSFF